MKLTKLLAIGVLTLLFTGCAGIINGTDQAITINSEPEGAQVYIDGLEMGITPVTVKLKKNAYDTVMLKKKGYKTETMSLEKRFDGAAILNIFWDLSTTDLLTGAIYEYEPNKFFVTMKKGDS